MTRWLLDTSALAQRGHAVVHERLMSCVAEGAAVCDMVVAESLIRARSTRDLTARRSFFDVMDVVPVDAAVWEAVKGIAERLAVAGTMVATGDAVIAACAALHGLTVVHYDSDYEVLGRVCDIAHEWVVPSGTLG